MEMYGRKARIVLAAGGTGGHVFPAQAVAEALSQSCSLTLVTDARGLRYVSGELANINLILTPVRSPSGSIISKMYAYWLLGKSVIGLFFKFLINRPDLVIGFGGYLSVPAVLAAYFLGIPTIIHEQNILIGRANSFLSNIATAVALSFDDGQSVNAVPAHKVFITGNPIRAKLMALRDQACKKLERKLFRVLVIGGSQGSALLSEVVPRAVARLDEELQESLVIYQQTPKNLVASVSELYSSVKAKVIVREFFENIDELLYQCDLVVARAGASTITELVAARKPSILVPLAAAYNNHQLFNAQYLEEREAALLLQEQSCTARNMQRLLSKIMTDKSTMSRLQSGIRKVKFSGDTLEMVELISQLINSRSRVDGK